MSKKESEGGIVEYTISQVIPQMSLNSREKFVCLKIFNGEEEHTLDEWKKLLKQKKIK